MNFAPHPFTLRQLQYLVAVADALSFRRAAERCHVSQPSLSAQLAQLEDVLGLRVFERDRKRVLVTTAGREIVDRARRLLLDTDDLALAGRRARDPLAGTIRIGIIPTISPYLLPSVAPQLRARFPRLTMAWREDKTDVVLTALEAGDLDAALLALEADVHDVEQDVIAVDRFVLAVRPSHPLAAKTGPVSAADLRGTDVLLLDDGHCFGTQALEFCATVRAREAEFRASLATLVQMVAGGAGVTLLPALSVPTEAARAGLVVRPLASPTAHRTIALVWRKQAPLGPTLKTLAAVMRAAFPASHIVAKNKQGASAPTNRKARRDT
jgi:LysR family hydrogen peroxide-inducible transcriptional activator